MLWFPKVWRVNRRRDPEEGRCGSGASLDTYWGRQSISVDPRATQSTAHGGGRQAPQAPEET